MALVAKRMSPDTRLKNQKKISAGTSIAGGTLGLSGLAALAAKKPTLATKLNIGAGGLGGVGAYNYASIQSQEAKRRGPKQQVYVVRNKKQIKSIKSGLEPVTKGVHGMDFGLNSVHQGTNVLLRADVDKALKLPFGGAARHAYVPRHAPGGYVPRHGAPEAPARGRHRAPKTAPYQGKRVAPAKPDMISRLVARTRVQTNAPAAATPAPGVATAARAPSMGSSLSTTWTPAAAPAAAGRSRAGQAGFRTGQGAAKVKRNWKPLAVGAAGGGAATFGGLAAITAGERRKRNGVAKRLDSDIEKGLRDQYHQQAARHHAVRSVNSYAKASKVIAKPMTTGKSRSDLRDNARAIRAIGVGDKHKAKFAAHEMMRGDTSAFYDAYGPRKVAKRFDSEGNRQKRLDRYTTGAKVGSVGLAGLAGIGAASAVRSKNPRTAALSGAAGLSAIGSNVAAHRISNYKKGKGASYRPLARRKPE